MGSGGGRLVGLGRGELDQEQARLYDMITGGPRARDKGASPIVDRKGCLAGPFGPMLLSPTIGEPLQELGAAIRYRSALSPRVREGTILMVAAEEVSRFEWTAHQALARAAGLTEEELAEIEAGGIPSGSTGEESALFEAALLLAHGGDMDDSRFHELAAATSEKALFELCTLVGYYQMLALVMRLFSIY